MNTHSRLTDFADGSIEADLDYDAVRFTDLDFSDMNADDARFLECSLTRCKLDGLSVKRARVIETSFTDVNASTVDFSGSVWRDSRITGGRLGAIMLTGATWTGIRVRGTKLGFVSLATARLDDVVFQDCEIDAIDASASQLASVTFLDCAVHELNVSEARLSKLDLSAADLRMLVGIDGLRGAIISESQLVDLGPQLAAQLGIEIRRPTDPGEAASLQRRPRSAGSARSTE